jgi:CRP-like cAMP-binding protein
MADQSALRSRTGNLLLDALGEDQRASLLAGLQRTPIDVGSTLFRPGDQLTYVPFPLSGTLSLIAQPDDGVQVEAATIGNEGAAELPTALGSQTVSQEVVGQVAGEMFAIPIETFTEHVGMNRRFRDLAQGYIEALIVQISLSASCNAVHHLNQRCARWLLQTHDRVTGDTFGLTQEYLAIMLGVQRPTVSVAQRTLKEAACITFNRGSITVVDREGLEEASCACYENIRTAYSALVPLREQATP